MDAASIRANAKTINDFGGRVVRIVGRITNYDRAMDSATIDADGPIQITVNPGDAIETGKIYEIIGKAGVADNKVNVYAMMQFSDNTNLDAANKLATFVQKSPELFY